MTYESETSLDQTASPSANGVKKVWSRPELDDLVMEYTTSGAVHTMDATFIGSS